MLTLFLSNLMSPGILKISLQLITSLNFWTRVWTKWGGAQLIPAAVTLLLWFITSRHSLKLSPEGAFSPSTELKQIQDGICTFSSSSNSTHACKFSSKLSVLLIHNDENWQISTLWSKHWSKFTNIVIRKTYLCFKFIRNGLKSQQIRTCFHENLQSSPMKILQLIQIHLWSVKPTVIKQILSL